MRPEANGAGDEHEGYGFEMNPMAITTASSKGGTRAEDTEVEALREQVLMLRAEVARSRPGASSAAKVWVVLRRCCGVMPRILVPAWMRDARNSGAPPSPASRRANATIRMVAIAASPILRSMAGVLNASCEDTALGDIGGTAGGGESEIRIAEGRDHQCQQSCG